MNNSIDIKNKDKKVERSLKKLYARHTIITELIDTAFWLSNDKKNALKMMVDIFMEFANELAEKKGFK